MVTKKRKGGKMADKTRRNKKRINIKRRLQKIDSTAEGINASQLVLTKQQQRASEVLDAAVDATASGLQGFQFLFAARQGVVKGNDRKLRGLRIAHGSIPGKRRSGSVP